MLNSPSASTAKGWSLRTKSIVFAVTLGTLPVLMTGAIAYHLANRSITKKELQFRQSQAVQLADKLNNFMLERYSGIQILAALPILSDPEVRQSVPLEQKQATLDQFIKTYGFYDSIAVADLQGRTLLQSTGEPVTGLGKRDYFQAVLKTNRPAITPPRKSALTGQYSIFVAAPVRDLRTGQMIAIVRSRLPVSYLAKSIENLEAEFEAGRFYVMDPLGRFFIADAAAEMAQEVRSLYPVFERVETIKRPVAQVITNRSRNREAIVAIAPTEAIGEMPNLNWFAMVDVDTAAAFDSQQKLLHTILWGTVVTALLTSVVAVFLANRATRSIQRWVEAITTATTEIAATMTDQERMVSQQSTSVRETTTAMNQLHTSSRQSVEQATAAFNSAQKILMLTDYNDLAPQYSGVQASLRQKVGQIAEQIVRLSEQTNQIGVISTLVSDLANQTNMLALNAAVEAARAGVAGKGFGVVATEIRKLADQSRQSAERINVLVSDIQRATHATVMVAHEGTQTVGDIVSAINTVTINSQRVALTARQQASAIQQVLDAMNDLNHSVAQTTAGITQTQASTQKLNQIALNLKALI